MWDPPLSRTFEYVASASSPKGPDMHGSIQLIVATETDKLRQRDAAQARRSTSRSPLARVRSRFAGRPAAHGVPPRAAPGMDSPLGHPTPAVTRGR
jgi:hypothetical protein